MDHTTPAFRCPDGRVAVPIYGGDGRAWLMIDDTGGTAVGFGGLSCGARALITEEEAGAIARYEEARRRNERLDAEGIRMVEEIERLRAVARAADAYMLVSSDPGGITAERRALLDALTAVADDLGSIPHAATRGDSTTVPRELSAEQKS